MLPSTASGELFQLSPTAPGLWATPTETPSPGDGKGKLQQWSSLIGIVTAIVGNVLIAMALNVQRYAHTRLHKERASVRRRARAALKRAQSANQNGSYGAVGEHEGSTNGNGNASNTRGDDIENGRESDPLTASYHSSATTEAGDDDLDSPKTAPNYLKSPYWWLGQVLITLGEMGNFLAYGFAPASIVSPLGVVALISNCIIAPLMFHEVFRHRDFWGVVIAVGGVVTVVLSANTEETKLRPDDVWGAITSLAFEIYLLVTVLLIIVLMWASPKFGRRTILIDLGLVGLFGGYTALATKGVSSMLSSTLWRAFATPVTYFLLFILLGTAIMQIRYVNRALQHFDSTQVIPIQFVMFTLCVILGSAILYRDFEKSTPEQAYKFVGGCLLTFFGVFLITSGRGHNEDDEDCLSEADGVEETIGLLDQEGNPQDMSDQPSTPGHVSRSRRSSKHSRAGNLIPEDAISPGAGNIPSLQFFEPANTPGSTNTESASFVTNPWSGGPIPATPPPPPRGSRGLRTLSADTVMRGSAVVSTPSLSNPATPIWEGQPSGGYLGAEQPLTPQTRAHTFGPSHQHHRSGTFISPSPLSSTVTAVVKDGFLRNDKRTLTQRSSMRHLRSRIRASLFFNEDNENGGSAALAVAAGAAGTANVGSDDVLVRTSSHQQGPSGEGLISDEAEEQARTRSRSMSDTLGDFFRPRRKKRKDEPSTDDDNEDESPGGLPGP